MRTLKLKQKKLIFRVAIEKLTVRWMRAFILPILKAGVGGGGGGGQAFS